MSELPAAKDDPAIVAANEMTAEYQQKLDAIRGDASLSELGKSQRIDELWSSWEQGMGELQEKFYGPRRERLAELEQRLPIGPGVPENASTADAAVLHQAFRAAFSAASTAEPKDLGEMFAEAKRFGDETTMRAVLTVASDKGFAWIIDAWAADDPERQAGLQELGRLRDLFRGVSVDAGFASRTFGRLNGIRQPQELAGGQVRAGVA